MTFAECYRSIAKLVPAGSWSLAVSAWNDGRTTWRVWLSAQSLQFDARNPRALLIQLEAHPRAPEADGVDGVGEIAVQP